MDVEKITARKVMANGQATPLVAPDAAPPADAPNLVTESAKQVPPAEPIKVPPQLNAVQQAEETAALAIQNEKLHDERMQLAELERATKVPSVAIFISKYPSLTIYPVVGCRTQRLDFLQGVLRVNSPQVADAVRREKRFGKLFEEAGSRETAAMRAAIEQRRTALKSATQNGLDTSSFGSDPAHMAQMSALDDAETKLNLMTDF